MQLKEHLINGVNYILLPEDGWDFLVQIYGTLDSLKVSLILVVVFAILSKI